MSLIEVDTLADVARRRDRMLQRAEQDVEEATGRAVRSFLARMLDRVENGLTAALVASPSMPFATSSLFTLGELQGWWAAEVDDHVTDAVARAWRLGHFDTSDLPLSGSSLAHSGEYLAKVTDRLSRTATPTIPEGAFDTVRTALADEMGRGSSTRQMTRRLGAELNWQGEQVPFWRDRLGELDGTIDRILDPMGPPGTKAREAHRLNDPQIRELQAQRADVVKRLDRDASVWETRAERISRTETTGAYNAGALDAGHEEGAGVKVWIATGDDRTRDSHLMVSGECVGIDDPFDVGGVDLMMPGDPSGEPGETVNCRCTIVFDSSCEAAGSLVSRAEAVIDEERDRREERGGVRTPEIDEAPAHSFDTLVEDGGAPIALPDDITATLDELNDEWGETVHKVAVADYTGYASTGGTAGNVRIAVNRDTFLNDGFVQKRAADMDSFVVGTSRQATTIHEFGHAVERRVSPGRLDRLQREFIPEAVRTGGTRTVDVMDLAPSVYALENQHEWSAEMFALGRRAVRGDVTGSASPAAVDNARRYYQALRREVDQ